MSAEPNPSLIFCCQHKTVIYHQNRILNYCSDGESSVGQSSTIHSKIYLDLNSSALH